MRLIIYRRLLPALNDAAARVELVDSLADVYLYTNTHTHTHSHESYAHTHTNGHTLECSHAT